MFGAWFHESRTLCLMFVDKMIILSQQKDVFGYYKILLLLRLLSTKHNYSQLLKVLLSVKLACIFGMPLSEHALLCLNASIPSLLYSVVIYLV